MCTKDHTVQKVFRDGFPCFKDAHKLPPYILKAISYILVCRTAILGGHVQGCPDKHFERVWYNSCKNKYCPLCAYIGVVNWLERQKERILNCPHFHVIFTIPHELNELFLYNRALMTQILFQCSSEALFELLADPKYLGAKPGIILTLHTWTRDLLVHPHIHALITAGGLALGGIWRGIRKNYLLPFRVLGDLFRGKVRAAIIKAARERKLIYPDGMNYQRLINLLNKVGRMKWNVKLCDQYNQGDHVLTYLGRYIRGGPIGNSRIKAIENGQVTFDAGRGKEDLKVISTEEFIKRYIKHISPKHLVTVRYYGIYNGHNKKELELCKKGIGQAPSSEPKILKWQDALPPNSETHPEICPVCGKRLVIIRSVYKMKNEIERLQEGENNLRIFDLKDEQLKEAA